MEFSALRTRNRICVQSPAEISIASLENYPLFITDISGKGAAGILNVPLEPREEVDLKIEPNFLFNFRLEHRAIVAWCRRINSDSWLVGLDFGSSVNTRFRG